MQPKLRSKLFSNFIALSIVQGTNFLLPLLVMPYVIKRIGADGFGVVAVAQVVMIYLSTISDYGFNLTATKDVALFTEDKERIQRLFFTVLASKLLICVALLILLLTAVLLIPALDQYFLLYTLGFTYVVGQSLLVSWYFQGIEKMHYITISTFISRLVFVALVFIFIREKYDAVYFLFFLGVGNIIAGVTSIHLAMRTAGMRFVIPNSNDIITELKNGWQIMISNVSINTYLYSGIFILRIFTNDIIVGYYSIAERIFFAVRQVLSIFSQVVYPRICQLSQQGMNATSVFFKKVYVPFLLLMLAGCTVLFIFSPGIIYIFLKDEATLPVLVLRLLSFVPVIVCLNIPAYQLLLAFDHKKSYLTILGFATILNICINIILVNRLGAPGTAVSVIVTELFITAGLSRELVKNKLGGFVSSAV